MTCFFCKGNMIEGTTTHFVELKNCIIVIKNVPCYRCQQCGEVVLNGRTAKKIEQITNTLKNIVTEVAVVDFENKIA